VESLSFSQAEIRDRRRSVDVWCFKAKYYQIFTRFIMTAALGNTSQGTPFATGVDAFVYPQFIGYALRAPTTQDIYNPGTRWQNNNVNPAVQYYTIGSGTWYELPNTSFGVSSVTGTANQITASATVGSVVLSIPSAFIAPGSIAATTTITAGTGIVSTTGNLTLSGTASGLVLTPTVGSGAASGTVAANGRVVSVTFTGVSIASGATQAFTTSNTSITGSGTVLALSWSGATAGSALSVVSIVNTAGQSVITITNGTSATMVTSVANITFTYFVLN
jgi:hypothetical protein